MITERTQRMAFSVAPFYSLEYNLAPIKLRTPQTMNPPSASRTPGLKTPATIVAASIATLASLEKNKTDHNNP
jgi:hypothetical protein